MRYIVLLVSALIFLGSFKSLLDYWQYEETAADVAELMENKVSQIHLEQKITAAIQADKPEDARMYLSIAQTFGYSLNVSEYEQQIAVLEEPLNVARRTLTDFADGFINGSADSSSGVAGAIVSDFTVVGDGRDLWEQYELYDQGEPVNELIITLAGVGVGLTAATVVSGGTAAPVKAGVSTLKLATKSNRLTKPFQKVLLRQGKQVFNYPEFLRLSKQSSGFNGIRRAASRSYNPKALTGLENIAGQANGIRKASSLGDTLHLFKYVDNANDLRRLEKVTLKYGMQTKGIMKLLGKSAIGVTRVLRKSVELIVSAISSLFSLFGMLLSARRP